MTRHPLLCVFACLCAAAFAGEDKPAVKLDGLVGMNGTLQMTSGKRELCVFNIGLFSKTWQQAGATGSFKGPPTGKAERHSFSIKTPGGATIAGTATISEENGTAKCEYEFVPGGDVELNSLNVSAEFATSVLARGTWTADDKSGELPATFKEAQIASGRFTTLKLEPPGMPALSFVFSAPTQVLLQDNRQWGSETFIARIEAHNETGSTYKKGVAAKVSFALSAPGGIAVSHDSVTSIVAGPEWAPLQLDLDIEPGSALDFSTLGFHDAPAGKHGRAICRPDGQFAFEKMPEKPQRFYGVNFCFGALYLSHEESDRLAERLMRLGYNAVRVHHYEGELVSKQANSVTLNPQKLEQLDYLLAAFAKRGIYITTDLFVSRPVPYKDVGINKPGNIEMDAYKIMVPVVPAAMENWKAFTKALLTHENPYTKLRYADDPALAWLSMINEGMFGNFMDRVRAVPEWTAAWNTWLAKQYASREKLAEAWGKELKDSEDAAKGSVALPANIYAGGPRVQDCHLFFAATERDMIGRMKAFLREELGCKALVTNSNAWTNFVSDQAARQTYDYVDDHFYIDHPEFIESPWRLPSRCGNKSPIAGGASGGRGCSFTRLLDKPFTITEYNYSGPGRFRGVGGILTGAMGALQGWGGIWRFAYSHQRDNMFAPRPIGYFDMAADPLGQASERATLCLYLRGDMKAAPHSVVVAMTESEAASKPVPHLHPGWHWLAWVTRVGTQVVSDAKALAPHTAVLPLGTESRALAGEAAVDIKPYGATAAQILALLTQRKILGDNNPTDPGKNVFQSETGEITIDAPRDMLIMDTPRTAGGYAPAGKTITTADKTLTITMQDADATVWVSALDGQPLASSKRLLVTHLTDLQNTEIRYAEKARQTLLDWGKLPHLVRSGKAAISLKNANAGKLKVWALATSGKRVAEVAASAADGTLQFTADVAGGADGARLSYEVALP
ncbi:MAG: hypothetical protein NTW87_29230 [Planctomycetota bacterium]|nr:hypothetical protein [Planctomycetota bacterium]